MSAQVSLWKRFGSMFRGGGNGSGNSFTAATRAIDPTPHDQTLSAATGTDPLAAPRAGTSLMRWGRREPTVSQMREGYRRVAELMDSMQQHFQKQDERAEQLTRSVEHVAETMEQLAAAQRAQGEHVSSIATHVDNATQHTERLAETLGQMPASLELQAEAVRSVAQQLAISHESDAQLVHSLKRFGQAVDSLRASGAAQVETLQSLHARDREQKEALMEFVRHQSRRYLIAMIPVAVLGLGALITMGIILARAIDR